MDFELTEDQQQLRDSVCAVLQRSCPPAIVRQAYEEAYPSPDPLWAEMVRLDWPALTIPEPFGGLGLGFVELAIVVEELGRAVAPGPFLATATQYVPIVRGVGSPAQQEALLRPVAEVGTTGTLALSEATGRWEPESISATARPRGDAWVLEGSKSSVLDGASADEIAVIARLEGSRGGEGLGVFVIPGEDVKATPVAVVDPSQPMAEVLLEGVEVPAERVLAVPGDPEALYGITRAIQEATTAIAVAASGTCRAIFERTLEYAKDREQYGRPIGSFQALQHRLVDMYLSVERATSLVHFAAMTIAEDDDRRALAVAMAKAAVGECQRLVVQEGLQLHGGVGFMWEQDLHLFLKRARSAEALFGSAVAHRASVTRLLGIGAGSEWEVGVG